MSTKATSRLTSLKHATVLTAYLLVVWGFYRLLFKLPEEIEELVTKPIIWLIPVIYFVRKEKDTLQSIGITLKKLFPSIYLSLGLGLLFLGESLLVNYLKYKNFSFGAFIGDKPLLLSFGLSFATAISEEVTFRGFIFTRFWRGLKNEWLANAVTTSFWVIIHIPITVFVYKLGFAASFTSLLLTGLFGIGSAILFARTGNIASSILLHVLWEWPIILFR